MKKQPISLTLAAVFTACSLIFPSCSDKDDDTPSFPTAGLVAYYPFDDNAQDESVYANHGSLKNGVQFVSDRNNQAKSAAYFDGSEAHIVIPHAGRIDFGPNDDFTISLWVKCGEQNDKNYQDNYILSKQQQVGVYPYTVRVLNSTVMPANGISGQWVGGRWDGTNNSGATLDKIDDNEFHHLVFAKAGNQLYFYTDGQLLKSAEDKTTNETRNNASLVVGKQLADTSTTLAFTGAVDDLRIYNRALTETEIQQLFKE